MVMVYVPGGVANLPFFLVWIVNTELADVAPGTTLAGDSDTFVPFCIPLPVRVTVLLNGPPMPETTTVYRAVSPASTLMLEGAADTRKSTAVPLSVTECGLPMPS